MTLRVRSSARARKLYAILALTCLSSVLGARQLQQQSAGARPCVVYTPFRREDYGYLQALSAGRSRETFAASRDRAGAVTECLSPIDKWAFEGLAGQAYTRDSPPPALVAFPEPERRVDELFSAFFLTALSAAAGAKVVNVSVEVSTKRPYFFADPLCIGQGRGWSQLTSDELWHIQYEAEQARAAIACFDAAAVTADPATMAQFLPFVPGRGDAPPAESQMTLAELLLSTETGVWLSPGAADDQATAALPGAPPTRPESPGRLTYPPPPPLPPPPSLPPVPPGPSAPLSPPRADNEAAASPASDPPPAAFAPQAKGSSADLSRNHGVDPWAVVLGAVFTLLAAALALLVHVMRSRQAGKPPLPGAGPGPASAAASAAVMVPGAARSKHRIKSSFSARYSSVAGRHGSSSRLSADSTESRNPEAKLMGSLSSLSGVCDSAGPCGAPDLGGSRNPSVNMSASLHHLALSAATRNASSNQTSLGTMAGLETNFSQASSQDEITCYLAVPPCAPGASLGTFRATSTASNSLELPLLGDRGVDNRPRLSPAHSLTWPHRL